MKRYETTYADRGVYFDIARSAPCQCCGEVIPEGADAIYSMDDGLLLGRGCGCGEGETA